MKFSHYLTFPGTCEAAFAFYAELFGGQLSPHRLYRDAPGPADKTPSDWLEKVMHAELSVDDQLFMGTDLPPPQFHPPQGMHINISTSLTDRGQLLFDGLATGGQAIVPFAQTFWSKGFGMCTDQFGIPWMVNVIADDA